MCCGALVHFRPPLQGAGEETCLSVIESTFSLCLGFSNASDILIWWHVCIYVTKILSTWKMYFKRKWNFPLYIKNKS